MPTEVHPVGTFPKTEANPDPLVKGKSLAELQELVEWPSKMQEALQEQVVPESAPEPMPPPPEVPVESPVPKEQEETPSEAEPAKEPEPAQEDIEKELLKAQIEALDAHAKKLEAKIVGREAGEKGYIKQLQERLRKAESGEQTEAPPELQYRQDPPIEPAPQQQDGFRLWAVQKASQEAIAAFQATHPDLTELESEAAKYLQETGFDARSVMQLNDPIAAGREMTRVLDEAYWHAKETKTRARISELQIRKADQVRGIDEAKRRSAPSASGSPPVAATPRKGIRDLSLPELEAEMKRLRSSGGR